MTNRFFVLKLSGIRLFVLFALLVSVVVASGCRKKAPDSTGNIDKPGDVSREESSVAPDNAANSLTAKPLIQNEKTESQPTSDDIDDLIRLAAGPMAESVNSSLARLNTNLGRKEHTLVIMALNSETRRWYFLTHMVTIADKEQLQQATALIDSYDNVYKDLLDRRARILETERDGERVRQLLDYNKVAALKLTMQIRQRILREIFTQEQRKNYAAQFENPTEAAKSPDDSSSSDSATDN